MTFFVALCWDCSELFAFSAYHASPHGKNHGCFMPSKVHPSQLLPPEKDWLCFLILALKKKKKGKKEKNS